METAIPGTPILSIAACMTLSSLPRAAFISVFLSNGGG
jgi:hypothetical protein